MLVSYGESTVGSDEGNVLFHQASEGDGSGRVLGVLYRDVMMLLSEIEVMSDSLRKSFSLT